MGYRPRRTRLPGCEPDGHEGNDDLTRQNRVLPTGAIVAEDWRGTLMGNRGVLHDAFAKLGAARWRHKAWIACRLSFRGRNRQIMSANHYTELFFPDDAAALAAGHRPCFECRRAQATAFAEAWSATHGKASAAEIDRALHAARLDQARAQRRFTTDCATLPVHTFILLNGCPALISVNGVRAFARGGYLEPVVWPEGPVTVFTPVPIVALLAAGYAPETQF